jgi:hypothetical protein
VRRVPEQIQMIGKVLARLAGQVMPEGERLEDADHGY